jgi:hypothetical protein
MSAFATAVPMTIVSDLLADTVIDETSFLWSGHLIRGTTNNSGLLKEQPFCPRVII